MIASGSDDCTLRIWNWKKDKCLQVLSGHLSWVICVVNISRKHEIASGSSDGTVKIWDYKLNKESCNFDCQSAITSLNYNFYKNILTI